MFKASRYIMDSRIVCATWACFKSNNRKRKEKNKINNTEREKKEWYPQSEMRHARSKCPREGFLLVVPHFPFGFLLMFSAATPRLSR